MSYQKSDLIQLRKLLTSNQNGVILRELHEKVKPLLSSCSINLIDSAPSISEMTDLKITMERIHLFFRFICELNSIEVTVKQALRDVEKQLGA